MGARSRNYLAPKHDLEHKNKEVYCDYLRVSSRHVGSKRSAPKQTYDLVALVEHKQHVVIGKILRESNDFVVRQEILRYAQATLFHLVKKEESML